MDNTENKMKAAIHSLGCKVNSYESTAMKEALEKAGYEIVDFTEIADVYVINTCTVTAVADKKSRQIIRRAKNKNPNAIVAACGCYVEKNAQAINHDCDILLGNDTKVNLVEEINKLSASRQYKQDTADDFLPKNPSFNLREYIDSPIHAPDDKTRAFIKIQEGCNQFCSYCIIPYVRGRSRSRAVESIISEVENIAKTHRELVFCGINLSDYSYGGYDLSYVIQRVNDIDGIERIRLGSLEPDVFTRDFVDTISKCEKVCKHFHFSLQSASDDVLAVMNRRYTYGSVKSAVDLLNSYYYKPAICADIIAGFPSESQKDFETGYERIRDNKLFQLHVFPFSKRKGTKAYNMQALPSDIVSKRAKSLINLSEELEREYKISLLGDELEVLFEEKQYIGGQSCVIGHSREYIKCAMAAENDLRGSIGKYRAEKLLDNGYLRVL